ncbi:AAA family ATPase [Mangrovicella endophytica]|uniref:AAA family ATPase n=1 Tax=Mangrovicella endophytica TaxID=2066697 RepID=UPI000C9E118E|nr:AAA family ATPase [Mangrovicella endophytica]
MLSRGPDDAASRHVVLSGCSGGGKSTLLAELACRGFRTVPEPGRRIVEAEQRQAGAALPWTDLAAFARRALDMARDDRKTVSAAEGWVFFDRGLVDAAVALELATGAPARATLAEDAPYHRRVFLTPPWPEIYATDRERRHGLDEAVAEYERLARIYPKLGYETIILPKIDVSARADMVLRHLG